MWSRAQERMDVKGIVGVEAKGNFGKGPGQTGQFGALGGVGELITLALYSNRLPSSRQG